MGTRSFSGLHLDTYLQLWYGHHYLLAADEWAQPVHGAVFHVRTENLRANDRFTVEFPAEVDYHGKKYYGVTGDASETGLSLIFSQSAYLPHKKEKKWKFG